MLAIILIIVAIMLGAIYWFMKQQEEEEPVVTEPVVVDTTPAGPDVDIFDGAAPKTPQNSNWVAGNHHNGTQWVNSQGAPVEWFQGEQHVPIWAQWYLVGAGQANSWKDCQEAARREGHKSWGYRKNDKSCWAYYDNNFMMNMRNPGTRSPDSNVKLGCTEPGVLLSEGCEDWSKGDRVRGYGGSGQRVTLGPDHQGLSLSQCIAKGKAKGIDAIFYHTQSHPDRRFTATCYEIKDSYNLTGYTGSKEDIAHVQACTDPSKKIINGCQ